MNEYLDFLSEIFEVEFASFSILISILLFTFCEIFQLKKFNFGSLLIYFPLNLFVFFVFIFFMFKYDPINNFSSERLSSVIINNFPNRFIFSNTIIVLNIIFFLLMIFSKKENSYNLEEHSKKVIDWCVNRYPKSGVKKSPKLNFDKNKSINKGEYYPNEKKIIIFTKNIDSKEDLTHTLIHEYFHYYLDHGKSMKVYEEQLESEGYENHPQELICNISAEKLTKIYFEQNEI
ncbi:MAG: hypothetical protein HWE24_17605 [Oceanospirillaceae bacterium]|nr:hypothetical protein [Oceanospirillaceae bacterium]